jgi:predicted DNA-binding protein
MDDVAILSARPSKSRSRYTVDLPCVLDQRLTALASEHGITKAEIIRDAVRLLTEYDNLKKEGYATGAWRQNPDGSRETVRISIGV